VQHASELEIPDGPLLEVDLGCGDGRFLLERAQEEPDRLFVGLDRDQEALEHAAAEAALLGLENLWLANADLATALDGLFFTGRVHRFHLHFPDGWLAPTRTTTLEHLLEALEPRGEIFLQTEARSLAEAIRAALERDPRVDVVEALEASPFDARSSRELSCEATGLVVHRVLGSRKDEGEPYDEGWD
jgi:tRNA G46 methylase TrmB